MVILGAQAPTCDKKPKNPTSATAVGTMSGTAAYEYSKNPKSREKKHQPQYQGLLHTPNIPLMFDN